jgi:hypothetical protein
LWVDVLLDTNNEGVIKTHKNILAYLAPEFAGNGAVGPGAGFDNYLEMIMKKTWNALRAINPLPIASRQSTEYPNLPARVASFAA